MLAPFPSCALRCKTATPRPRNTMIACWYDHSMKTTISLLKTETRMTVVALVWPGSARRMQLRAKHAKPAVQTPAAFKELAPEHSKKPKAGKQRSQRTT